MVPRGEEGAIASEPDKPDLAASSSSSGSASPSLSWYLHYGALALLLAGGAAWWALKPATINPMADPRAAEAMALVQTHRALGAPTLLQAINEHVRLVQSQDRAVRIGEWTVKHLGGDRYMVAVTMREQSSTKQWFERDYQWQADVAKKAVMAVSMPAESLMPINESGRVPLVQPR
jgi:hypothetical protein